MDKLVLSFKDSAIKEYTIDKPIYTIGRRADNDIQIDNQVVSGLHARIIIKGDDLLLEDMQSTNGTFLNQQKTSSAILCNNDVITIGKHTLTIQTDRVAAPKAEANDMDKTMVIAPTAKAASAPTAQAGAAPATLFVVEGAAAQKEYELKGRLTIIGKAESANIKLKGFFTPKTAALINRAADGYFLSPPAEGSKVKLNGAPVKERTPLKDGDLIELYGLKLQFVLNR